MAHMGHAWVYILKEAFYYWGTCTPPIAPSGASSTWILNPPPHRGIISENPLSPAIWGVTFSNLNRRTPYSPFDLINTNNTVCTNGPIGGQKLVPQLILPEDM